MYGVFDGHGKAHGSLAAQVAATTLALPTMAMGCDSSRPTRSPSTATAVT